MSELLMKLNELVAIENDQAMKNIIATLEDCDDWVSDGNGDEERIFDESTFRERIEKL